VRHPRSAPGLSEHGHAHSARAPRHRAPRGLPWRRSTASASCLAQMAADEQQALLLEALDGSPGAVSYERLREIGVEYPASVASELELAGLPLERCYTDASSPQRAVGVRAYRSVFSAAEAGVDPDVELVGESVASTRERVGSVVRAWRDVLAATRDRALPVLREVAIALRAALAAACDRALPVLREIAVAVRAALAAASDRAVPALRESAIAVGAALAAARDRAVSARRGQRRRARMTPRVGERARSQARLHALVGLGRRGLGHTVQTVRLGRERLHRILPATARSLGAGQEHRRWLAPAALLGVAVAVVALAISELAGSGANTRARSSGAHAARRVRAAARGPAQRLSTRGAAAPGPARAASSVPVSPELAAQLEARGHVLLEAGATTAAVPVLQQALAASGKRLTDCLQPASETCLNYAYALYDLGRALLLAHEPAAAVLVLERRLQIANQQPAVQSELALARTQSG
jgi:hypothetical protein